MEPVVAEVFVAHQLKDAIRFRAKWRQMQDPANGLQHEGGLERMGFLSWAKGKYRTEGCHQQWHAGDVFQHGATNARQRKSSR